MKTEKLFKAGDTVLLLKPADISEGVGWLEKFDAFTATPTRIKSSHIKRVGVAHLFEAEPPEYTVLYTLSGLGDDCFVSSDWLTSAKKYSVRKSPSTKDSKGGSVRRNSLVLINKPETPNTFPGWTKEMDFLDGVQAKVNKVLPGKSFVECKLAGKSLPFTLHRLWLTSVEHKEI